MTESNVEDYWPRIQGFPKQITNGHPNHFPPLVVPGPDIPGKNSSTDPPCMSIVH